MLVYFYNKIPKSLRHKVGKAKALKSVRDLIFRNKGVFRESIVKINRSYLEFPVEFKFVASIKDASKAYSKGVENTLLRNSITLLKKYNKDLHDISILDIGANFGYLSLVWAKSVCKTGQVISFEPNKNVYNSLLKSIAINNLNNIQVENLAIGNENKSVNLFFENSTTSNVIQSDISQSLGTIQMIRIDDFIKSQKLTQCHLVKIDVDGIELDILKGSINMLNKFRPIVIVEINDDIRIVEFFIENNYQVLNGNLKEYDSNKPLPPNIYCIPKSN
ncbi:FkbM family methyltransferase [Psychroserpens ponticola]|uniref:FkbM family methyltransferase n=1 Tax=Psychroserpens ponticola TaxID=2932268 RepID=A0ABY7RZS5_9FLAO|nr:FkbM family methyltransferase [Psychroserpens ponticola]WCO02538.1 FkbM family methyltransferase [Psychroserpens ponticola]